ncbi:6312_t:CDS:2, partial [Gigaspora rosea]
SLSIKQNCFAIASDLYNSIKDLYGCCWELGTVDEKDDAAQVGILVGPLRFDNSAIVDVDCESDIKESGTESVVAPLPSNSVRRECSQEMCLQDFSFKSLRLVTERKSRTSGSRRSQRGGVSGVNTSLIEDSINIAVS